MQKNALFLHATILMQLVYYLLITLTLVLNSFLLQNIDELRQCFCCTFFMWIKRHKP